MKRKLVKAGLFGNGLVLMMTAATSVNHPKPVVASATVSVDPYIRQLEGFDSSFNELSEFPEAILSNVPKIQLNSHVARFVTDYNKRNSDALEKIRERSSRYFPVMDSIFSIYQLPVELKYLAVIESKLKPSSVSHAGAAGLWQLMPSTARKLSLKVRNGRDDRTNYYKSTMAAAQYLKELYNEFGDWLLVIAAYNSGPGKVLSAIKNSGSHNYWALQQFLPAETKGHVKRFISTHYYFEGNGSITTLTRSEAAVYRNLVSQFIAEQKNQLLKDPASASDTSGAIVLAKQN